jgi:hypothetical protein
MMAQPAERVLEPLPWNQLPPVSSQVLANAGAALAAPPKGLEHSAANLAQVGRFDVPYVFPIGWRGVDGEARLINASFVGEVNHIEVSGMSDSGKDGWVRAVLLYLCLSTPPQKLQLAILDGKGGMSWQGWGKKAHTWLIAEEEDQLVTAMQNLVAERERRQRLLKAAGCEKWEEYEGDDLPLLVVLVSEITLLEKAFGKSELESWLNAEMVSARASGIRYILATQTFSGYSTKFRGQISLFVAGYQNRSDADDPNTGLTRKELLEYGKRVVTLPDGRVHEEQLAVAPSMLPDPPYGAGVFTCVKGKVVVTVRQSLIDKSLRERYLAMLPDRGVVRVAMKPVVFQQAPVAPAARIEYQLEPAPLDGAPTQAHAATVTDQEVLRQLIAQQMAGSLSLKELQANAVFQRVCLALYSEIRSYKSIVERLWGAYTGPRADCVKEALVQAARQQSMTQDETLLQGLLAA